MTTGSFPLLPVVLHSGGPESFSDSSIRWKPCCRKYAPFPTNTHVCIPSFNTHPLTLLGAQSCAGGTERTETPLETETRCWLGQGNHSRARGAEEVFVEEVTDELGLEMEQG